MIAAIYARKSTERGAGGGAGGGEGGGVAFIRRRPGHSPGGLESRRKLRSERAD
jgi:hypothetical protein